MGLFDKLEDLAFGTKPSKPTEGAYPAELERLIEIAIEDGKITPQERQVLYKKAAKYDIDSDELDMILSSRLGVSLGESAPTKKNNGVKKCPSCGAVVSESNIVHCPYCNFKLVNIVKDILDALNIVTPPKKDNKIGGFFGKIVDMLDYSDAEVISMKEDIIISYHVPIVKDVVLEFLAFSVHKGCKDPEFEYWNDDLGEAWYKKSEQVIAEARCKFGHDKEFMSILKDYAVRFGIEKKGLFGGLFKK